MAISYVGDGAGAAANNASVSPALPSGLADGDLMVAVWQIRSGVATVSASGWSAATYYRNTAQVSLAILTRTYVSGDTAPTLSPSGGSLNNTVTANVFALRGTVGVTATGTVYSSDVGLTQDIGPITGVTSPAGGAVVVLGGKADNWTSVATLTGDSLTWTTTGSMFSTLGDDAAHVGNYALTPSGVTTTSKTFTVTGGSAFPTVGVQLAFAPDTAAPPITVINRAALDRAHNW